MLDTKQSNINYKIFNKNESDIELTALYCRLSQDDGNIGDSDSIQNQKKLLSEYAEKNNFTPYRFYIDDGFSGTTFERPSFKNMLSDTENGSIKRIICKDLSRFGRDYIQVGFYTEILFPEKDIHFIAINDDVDSNISKDNDLTPFKNLFNEWYAKDTSKKIRAIVKSKGMSGEKLSSFAPYGYYKNPDNPKEWLVDEESSKIVRYIFKLCLEGHGPLQIANILKERKFLCPSAYAHSKSYPIVAKTPSNPYQWSSVVVSSILERMEYLGHTVNFKTHRKSYKHSKKIFNDKKDWKIFKNTHEAIIDQSTYDMVQKIRQGRRRQNRDGYVSIFSGILFCADCGAKMTFAKQNDYAKDHYICSNYRHNTRACSIHYIRYKVVEEILLENIRETISYVKDYENEFVEMIIDTNLKARNKLLLKKKHELLEKEKRYNYLDELFQHIYEDNIIGKLSDERFKKLSQGYEKEQNILECEINNIKNELVKKESENVNVKNFLKIVRKYTRIEKLTSEILHEFIDKIIIHEADKSTGKRIQEIEIVYNHVGKIDQSKIKIYNGKAI